jgi:flagellin
MEIVVAISITPQTPAQVAPSDLAGNQSSQTAGAQAAGVAAETGFAPETSPSSTDQITAHAGLVALANRAPPPDAGGLVNPDLDGDGARLQALQLQQQLSVQTVPIANQAPQALLNLLR